MGGKGEDRGRLARQTKGATGDPEFDGAYDADSREPGAAGWLLTPAVRQRILQTRLARLMTVGPMLIHVNKPDLQLRSIPRMPHGMRLGQE